MTGTPSRGATAALTVAALAAFAANSVLCRLALRGHAIDAASFSAVRLTSGALVLALLLRLRRTAPARAERGSWGSALALFGYAIPFSYAYLTLSTGTGALILFGAVQLSMLALTLVRGHRPGALQWGGIVIAFGGLVWLLLPGLTAPSPLGAALMLVAGSSWGVYSIRGRGAADALGQTAGNFARTVPLVAAVWVVTLGAAHAAPMGLLWAALSGAVASGVGYAVWYRALPYISAVTAAVVQLSVPLMAGLAGVLLLGETVTVRLLVAAILVLGGIGITIAGRRSA